MALQELDDEYAANALKSDAAKASIKYSSLGLSAYLPKRPTGAAPKANTRFLRNLIRETDTHNSALLAKEKRETRDRERERDRASRKRDHGRLSPPEEEYNQRHKRRRRHEDDEHRSARRRRSRSRDDDGVKNKGRHRRRRSRSRSRSSQPSRPVADREKGDSRRVKYGRDRSASPGETSFRPHRRSRSRKSTPPKERYSRNDENGLRRHRRTPSASNSRSRSPSPPRKVRRNDTPQSNGKRRRVPSPPTPASRGSSSDPLEAIVGPLPPPRDPPVRSRGRGAFSSTSAMDEHFNSSYDPKIDVQPDPETEDDWDQALEALRDRQKWKQQGAERLRAAGFSDLEVKKWEKGDQKDESDVKWVEVGQGREWDRGKIVGDDGVEVRPEWGRLKDS